MRRPLTAAELWDEDDEMIDDDALDDDDAIEEDDGAMEDDSWNPAQHDGAMVGYVRDPVLLRRRAKFCRDKASETPHVELAEAFIGLAEALELAAYVSDLAAERVLH